MNPNFPIHLIKMATHRSVKGTIQRKPLADCTNTVSRSSQQLSSSSPSATLLKFTNPSLTSSLKRLVNQTKLKEITNDVNHSEVGSGSASQSLSMNVSPVTRRLSADLDFPTPAPSCSPKSRDNRGVGEKEFAEPYSVYTVRRKASGVKRNKDTSSSSSVARLRLDLIPSSGKKTHQGSENKSEPMKVASKKKQRKVKHGEDNFAHGVSQNYIKQQRAYFEEVDAFELLEEEVTSNSD